MTYAVQQNGNTYVFSPDTHTFAGWSLHANGEAHSDGFSLVAKMPLERGEGVAFGRGNSENPDKAEAYRYLDARSDDADADGTPDKLSGSYQLVVLNPANKALVTIDRGRLDELRRGDPDSSKRGEWGKPMKYRALGANGSGEVLGGKGHKIGLKIKLDDNGGSLVTDALNLGNSQMAMEGYAGEIQN